MIADGARHFEDFDGVTYLNCAAKGPLPLVSIQAIKDAIPLNSFPNRIPDDILFRIPNGLRSSVAPFIGAEPQEIIVGTGASHGVNVAALGFPWKAGDEIVVASNDFPSNVYIWSQAARRNEGKRILVKGKRHAATTDEILAAVTPRTRVVAVSYVDFGSGEVIDLEPVAAVCREQEIFLAVDATQAVGVIPMDVKSLGIPLLTVGAYKWMLGPYGAGFSYLDPAWAERIEPSYITWTAAEGAENFNALPREDWKWVQTARRYDCPEAASFLNMAGLTRSAQFIAEIGLEEIHRHVTELLAHLERELPKPFRRRATPSRIDAPILCIESDDVSLVHRVYKRLREEKIWVSLREDGIRVSPHIYNTQADIERLLGFLAGH